MRRSRATPGPILSPRVLLSVALLVAVALTACGQPAPGAPDGADHTGTGHTGTGHTGTGQTGADLSGVDASGSGGDGGVDGGAADAIDPAGLEVLHPTVWLCRPDMVDSPCESGLDATTVAADGRTTVERLRADRDAPVDCFYVLPTTSVVPAANAPLRAEQTEIRTARAQAGRFSASCRVYAPVYQQYTAVSVFDRDGPTGQARQLAYTDVRSAWNDYLINDNQGRGVILVGSDQGAGHLARLLQEEIDNRPGTRARLVSALLVGANVEVPAGRDVGGDFQNVPACRRHDQIGCVVAFSSYAATPPVDAAFGRISGDSLVFGRDRVAGREVLCTNPAALGGGVAEPRSYFPTADLGGDFLAGMPRPSLPVAATPFVAYPGLLRAQCRAGGGASWLQVDTRAGDARRMPEPASPPSWGLHMLDVYLTLGDLVELAGRQGAAYVSGAGIRLGAPAGVTSGPAG